MRRLIALPGLCVAAAALAAPAPWYQWRSTLDGKLACLQASPGAGWVKAGGPYDDARCQPLSGKGDYAGNSNLTGRAR